MAQPNLIFLDRKDPALKKAWATIVALPMNRTARELRLTDCDLPDCPCCHDPESGEVWQYMGTVRRPGELHPSHEFRHRYHPATRRREYVRLQAEDFAWPEIVL